MTSATIGNTRLPSKRVISWLTGNPIRPAAAESATVRPKIAAVPGAMSNYWPYWPIPTTPNTRTRSIGLAKNSTRTSSISNTPMRYWLLDSEKSSRRAIGCGTGDRGEVSNYGRSIYPAITIVFLVIVGITIGNAPGQHINLIHICRDVYGDNIHHVLRLCT